MRVHLTSVLENVLNVFKSSPLIFSFFSVSFYYETIIPPHTLHFAIVLSQGALSLSLSVLSETLQCTVHMI